MVEVKEVALRAVVAAEGRVEAGMGVVAMVEVRVEVVMEVVAMEGEGRVVEVKGVGLKEAVVRVEVARAVAAKEGAAKVLYSVDICLVGVAYIEST